MESVFINGWTKETVIDHIKKNFKGRSTIANTCCYRGHDGKKCAVGMFIPDEEYTSDMETHSIRTLINLKIYPKLMNFLPLTLESLTRLQRIHDDHLSACNHLETEDSDTILLRKLIQYVESLT